MSTARTLGAGIKKSCVLGPYVVERGSLAHDIEALYRARYVTFRNGMVGLTGSYESARDVEVAQLLHGARSVVRSGVHV